MSDSDVRCGHCSPQVSSFAELCTTQPLLPCHRDIRVTVWRSPRMDLWGTCPLRVLWGGGVLQHATAPTVRITPVAPLPSGTQEWLQMTHLGWMVHSGGVSLPDFSSASASAAVSWTMPLAWWLGAYTA